MAVSDHLAIQAAFPLTQENLAQAGLFVEPLVIRYLNRLSDYFFELARYVAYLLGAEELPWRPRI